MEHIYAALLLHSADKELTEDNISQVLEAAGADVDTARVKALVTALEGVDVEEAIESASMPSAAPAPSGGTEEEEVEEEAEEEAAPEEEEEEAEEEEEEEAAAGIGDLFEG